MRRTPPSFVARRRRMLKLQVAEHLDNLLENRSTVTPVGAAALGLSIVGAAAQPGSMHANGGVILG